MCNVTAVLFRPVVFCALFITQMPAVLADDPLLDLNSYRGKVVYLDFWASWCIPCKVSFPWMQKMQSRYQAQGLQIVTVNLDENQADADAFLKEFSVNFEVIRDPKGELAEQYSLKGMPTTVLFDSEGNQVARHVGFRRSDEAEYEAEIAKLLTQIKAD